MPIEFRCRQCGKLLRTGDDTAGRQAQCPGCGAISVVAASTAPSEWSIPLVAPPGAGDPFAAGPAVAGVADSENPYQSPIAVSVLAAQRVSGPATALIVTAILGILAHLVVTVVYAILLTMSLNGQIRELQPQQEPAELAIGSGVLMAIGVLGLMTGLVALFGAIKMRRCESYPFAIAASIIVMIPCISPCTVLGLPFGIWALLVLSDGSVKAAFRS